MDKWLPRFEGCSGWWVGLDTRRREKIAWRRSWQACGVFAGCVLMQGCFFLPWVRLKARGRGGKRGDAWPARQAARSQAFFCYPPPRPGRASKRVMVSCSPLFFLYAVETGFLLKTCFYC